MEKELKPKQDLFVFPKTPKEKPEDGEILPDLSPSYTLQQAPSSCEASPIFNGEAVIFLKQIDAGFRDVGSKFYSED